MTDIQSRVLTDGDVAVSILSFGAITQSWRVGETETVLGFADPEDYRRHIGSMGVVIGRVANRISGAQFDLMGEHHTLVANEGSKQLHGGPEGWHTKNWQMEADGERAVRLTLQSPDGDMGFPGAVDVEVTISLNGHTLTYDMAARPDRATPIAIANHNYYNLNGGGDIWGHRLQIDANHYTPTDTDLIPTGHVAPVAGTVYDYRTLTRLDDAFPQRGVTDVNFVLEPNASPACTLVGDKGLRLRLWTDQEGLQIYSGHGLKPKGTALAGQTHAPCTGLAIEAQAFPNAVNIPAFPPVICTPDRPYRQITKIEIAPE